MYLGIPQGSEVDIQGLKCHIPEKGYVYNAFTKQVEYRGIYSRSDNPKEQYWEKIKLPDWYKEVMKKWDVYDKNKKEDDPDFYDARLEPYKQQEWDRRLNGFWFMNNGEAVYLTGLHYMYLQWWQIDIGSPKFRITDLEYFYFLDYCIEDPNCMGMLEITKRRFGKTYRGGIFLYEYITRTKRTNAGIQSKTGTDAKKLYNKAVINPFILLPKFFRPEYDMSGGMRPKTALVFQQTNVKGRKAETGLGKDELGSMIDHEDSDTIAYDGQKIHRYFADEWAKCFSKGTKIRMYDGSVKNIEDIQNGELVMGDDSTPRLTYGKTSGKERMYRIIPNSGEPFECNESHILSLKIPTQKEPLAISVRDYISLKDWQKKNMMLWRVGVEYNKQEHLLEPYFLGAWLGDGNSRCSGFSSNDVEVIEYMNDISSKKGLFLRKKSKYDYHISTGLTGGKKNVILSELQRLNLILNKHIPNEYLIDSLSNRLELLAGLLDTDGNLYVRNGITLRYEITQKRKQLACDIQELSKSCGFKATLYKRKTSMVRKDGSVYKCDVYKVCIYGEIYKIPCKVERKKAKKIITEARRKNPLRSGFKIEPIGDGEYFGFAVGDNHLFLLADYTVSHNTVSVNIYDRHEVIRYCLMDDEGNIIGKALYSSTVEKLETDKEGVQEAAKKLWDESDQNNRQENGRTPSGLYRFFMTADRARNFDIYGIPNVEKTVKEILADRDSVKNNPRALAARTRKEARTIDEAWYDDGEKCVFNVIKIINRENYLSKNPIPKRNILYYRDGETQKVKWRDARKGEDFYWKMSPDCDLNTPNNNKFVIENGQKVPSNKKYGAITIDSYSNSQGGRKYGSKASAWLGIRKDGVRKAVGWLYGRPNVKEELHEQVMLCAEYMGYLAWYEHTSDDYLAYFRDRGKVGYLGIYPLSLIDPVKKKNKEHIERHRGTPITPFSLTKQLDKTIYYFEEHIDWIDFEELFPFAKKFDPYNRTEYDAMVSFQMLVTILDEPLYEPPPIKSPLIQVFNKDGSLVSYN